MSTSNGKITAPVTLLDIARTIGVASDDLGTLCTSNIVNKWSKYKPEQYRSANDLTDEQHRNAVNLVGTIVPYGLFKKTAGVTKYWCSGATVNSTDALTNQGTIEEVKQGMVWNYEGQPKVDRTRVLGTVKGKKIYATKGDFRCRKADFAGYDHRAKPFIEVEWVNLKASDEGLGGLYAKITYNDVNVAEGYGGLTREDLGLDGYRLVLVGQTVDNQTIVETGYTEQPRYIIAGHTQTTIDGTMALGFTDHKLAPLMGDVNFFFILVNKNIEWSLYAESIINGVFVNPDGWTSGNTYYYPIMKTLPDTAYFVEGSAYRASFPDGLGTVIWGTEEYNNNLNNTSQYWVKLYADVEIQADKNNGTPTVDFLNNPYATFDDSVGLRGFTIKTKEELLTDVRRAYRRLAFECVNPSPTSFVTNDYLNKCASVSGEAGAFVGGLKPLLRNCAMSAGGMTLDIYLQYEETTEYKGYIVLRYKDSTGNVVLTRRLDTGWGASYSYGIKAYKSIVLENIVSVRNQIVGFRIIVSMGDGSVYTFSSFDENSQIMYNGAYPVPFSREAIDNDTSKFVDLEILLPEDLEHDASSYGGDVMITYDVNKTE